ncbi:MAG: dihydrolipoamide acetyltransferase family protein [Bacteroidales bacterium]|nr:dihydrolipoamide acetyltransferase family protein [Bacteroidales bacterium]MDD4740363.1 dihydrolipoamide acetyltransferase family protein [Bacteroidales bacterium]
MANFEIIMPKMGESIIEATITKWLKNPGDTIAEDDSLAEIATDKVDSEIPSPVEGTMKELLYNEGDVVPVGKVIAIIEMEGDEDAPEEELKEAVETTKETTQETKDAPEPKEDKEKPATDEKPGDFSAASRFYSPLVKSIAKAENIALSELEKIKGSGKDNRVTKDDLLQYLDDRKDQKAPASAASAPAAKSPAPATPAAAPKMDAPKVSASEGDEIVEMDRMRKLIADHMVMSKQVSPHVTSFIEVDVTNIVNWRNSVKDAFQKREGQKITYTPIFIEATARVLREFPMINASLDGTRIIKRKRINIGMATALPDGNLIVPVIKDADELNMVGMAKRVNDLANRARNNKLVPDEIQEGTFTVTNFGSFESLTGTPIINQPQLAILGLGAIKKRPVVLETTHGDVIAIRHIMILSLAYDHRVVDGALAGMYLQRLRDDLEGFDENMSI